jgi:hypothetical protein
MQSIREEVLLLARLMLRGVLALYTMYPAAALADCDFIDRTSAEVTTRLENDFITGGELKMPRAYVKSWAFKDGGTRDALMLSVWRATFLPYTREDETSEKQRERFRAGFRDQLRIIVGGGNPQDLVAQYAVRSEYGLPVNRPGGDLQGVLLPNGLYGQRMEAPVRSSNVYLARKGDHVTDIIRCRRWGDVPHPSCNHRTEVGTFHVEMTYPLSDLDKWEVYAERVAKLVTCFTSRMPSKVNGE